jgi:putative protein-disulfide isomerase
MSNIAVTYLFDPLCGWCYGAGPAMRTVAEYIGQPPQMLPTGLFSGAGAQPLTSGMVAHIRAADQRLEAMTGQEFSPAYMALLNRPGQRVDSTLATKAFGLLQRRQPEAGLAVLAALQAGRYSEGLDATDLDDLAVIAARFGLARAEFLQAMADPEEAKATDALVAQGHRRLLQTGRNGVPTVIVGDGQEEWVLPGQLLYGQTQALIAALVQIGAAKAAS